MDLSFARTQFRHVTALPVELAVLLVGVASRQAASPTARAQGALAIVRTAHAPLRPESGAFSASTALLLSNWKYS